MTTLPYVYWFNHLTELGCAWRRIDYDTRAFVRGLKQEDFGGYVAARLGGVERQFTSANIEELVAAVLPLIGKKLREDIDGPISIVPVPNSGMAQGVEGPFRSVELAEMVAKGFGEGAEVCPAIVWDAPRAQAHKTNEFRHPGLYEPHMILAEKPNATVVLFDDVLTSGSQMIAAARTLAKAGFNPARALVIARATKAQAEGKMFSKHEGQLELDEAPFDFDEF